MKFYQCGVREALEVDVACALQVFTGRFGDGACELGAANAADAHRLEGDCTGNLWVGAELRTMPCVRIGGNYERIILFIPGIETGCTPEPLIADSCDAQQMVAPEERLYSFVKFLLCHGDV